MTRQARKNTTSTTASRRRSGSNGTKEVVASSYWRQLPLLSACIIILLYIRLSRDGIMTTTHQSGGTLLRRLPATTAATTATTPMTDITTTATTRVFSDDKKQLLECYQDALRHLPIGRGRLPRTKRLERDLLFSHHYDAGNDNQWNANMRLEDPIPQHLLLDHKKCSVWEVGANTQAADSRALMEHYPQCQYHAYEPIPVFFERLPRQNSR